MLFELGGCDDVERELGIEIGVLLVAADVLGHLAADEQRVGPLGERTQDADLVLDLRPADHRDEGARRGLEERAQLLELTQEQQARIGREEPGHADRGGVRAVRGPEGVVHVEVAVRGQLARELGVVLRLAGVEASVLENPDPLVGQELPKSLVGGLEREGRILALRPAEVGAEHEL